MLGVVGSSNYEDQKADVGFKEHFTGTLHLVTFSLSFFIISHLSISFSFPGHSFLFLSHVWALSEQREVRELFLSLFSFFLSLSL